MEQLENPRHEHFALAVAAGATLVSAYKKAGFAPRTEGSARTGGQRLLTNVDIQTRIGELRQQTAAVCSITRQTIVTDLRACIAKAMEAGQLKVALEAIDRLAEFTGIAPLVGEGAKQFAPAANAKTQTIAERIAAAGGTLSVIGRVRPSRQSVVPHRPTTRSDFRQAGTIPFFEQANEENE